VRAIVRLFRVIEAAEAVEADVSSGWRRVRLAEEVRGAARFFAKEYPGLPGRLPGAARRQRGMHALRCSRVLLAYADPALHGDSCDIAGLKEDFARAVLRVGSGNWVQVAQLKPGIEGPQPFWSRVPRANTTIVVAALSFIAVCVQAAAKILRP
jgi:hypothetical protein